MMRVVQGVKVTCEATVRPKHCDMGWVCTGADLFVMMHAPGLPPSVLPGCLVAEYMRQPYAADLCDPQPFEGGDHIHVVAAHAEVRRREASR